LGIYRRPGTYSTLHELGETFREQLRRVAKDTGHQVQVIGDGPLGQIVFSDQPVFDYRSTIAGNREKSRAMMLGLFERDVFVNPMGTKLYLSLAHSPEAVEEFMTRLRDVLETLAR